MRRVDRITLVLIIKLSAEFRPKISSLVAYGIAFEDYLDRLIPNPFISYPFSPFYFFSL